MPPGRPMRSLTLRVSYEEGGFAQRSAKRFLLGFALFLILIGGGACAQPVIKAVVADPAPVIDGDLSDPCWQQAPSVTDFYFLADSTKAPEPTTAWLCYDQKSIYMAFDCKDSQPDKIVAQQKKRGGDIDTDDWVGFDLDCYCKYTHIVWFDVTAGGVQVEHLQTGDVSKIEWKGDWNAASRRVGDGYAVELAVPFSILQYDANRTSMGIAFIRRHARMTQTWWSPNMGPNFDATRFYVWDGLQLPKPEKKPLVLAYSLLSMGGEDARRRLGLDVKHAVTPSLTGLVTVNPDWRNVEQEVDSVDFSYTERKLPDSRPFFQEGANVFPLANIFYTRRIKGIDTGAKLSGKVGPYNLAFMHARDFEKEQHTVLQVGRRWQDWTEVWLCGIESRGPGVNNMVTETTFVQQLYDKRDRKIRFSSAYATADDASDPGLGKWYRLRLYGHGPKRTLGWGIEHEVTYPNFEPYLGITTEKDIRCTSIWLDTFDEFSEGRMTEWWAGLYADKADHMDGSKFYDALGVYGGMEFRNGTGFFLDGDISHRPPNHDAILGTSFYWGGRDLYRNGGISLGFGKQAGGGYLYWSLGQGWQINDKLSVRGSYEYAHLKEPSPDAYLSRQLVTTMAYDLDTERTLGGRLITRSGKTNFYLAYKQRVRAGLDAYIIFGDPNADQTKSAFTLKLIRLL